MMFWGKKKLKAELHLKYHHPKNTSSKGGDSHKLSPESFVQCYFYTLLC